MTYDEESWKLLKKWEARFPKKAVNGSLLAMTQKTEGYITQLGLQSSGVRFYKKACRYQIEWKKPGEKKKQVNAKATKEGDEVAQKKTHERFHAAVGSKA